MVYVEQWWARYLMNTVLGKMGFFCCSTIVGQQTNFQNCWLCHAVSSSLITFMAKMLSCHQQEEPCLLFISWHFVYSGWGLWLSFTMWSIARSACVTLMWGLSMAVQNTMEMQKGSYYINLPFSISFNKFIYYPTPFTSSLCWQNATIMDVKISGEPTGLYPN